MNLTTFWPALSAARLRNTARAKTEAVLFSQCTGRMCMASSKLIYPEKTDPIPLLREAWNEGQAVAARSNDNRGERLGAVTGSALHAVSLALEALRYGGVGDDRPHNRLIQLIEAERSKCTGDNWDYWNYLSEKLQKAEHELAVLPAPELLEISYGPDYYRHNPDEESRLDRRRKRSYNGRRISFIDWLYPMN